VETDSTSALEVGALMWHIVPASGTIVVMNALSKEESDRLLSLLEKHVRQADLSQREMERRLGLSQGYLGGLFKGRIQLKVSHVYGLARILEMEPLYFFLHASPPKDPEWLMNQLGIGSSLLLPFLMGGSLPKLEELSGIIREALRSELGRLFGMPFEEADPDQS
jgi:transcriptional regulator with XRE-family HTH domain